MLMVTGTQTTPLQTLSIRTHLTTNPRKRLPHSSRQLEAYQARKHHNIPARLHATLNSLLLRARFEFRSPQLLHVVAAGNDNPEHDVADRARDNGGQLVEGVGGVADGGHVARGFGWQEA